MKAIIRPEPLADKFKAARDFDALELAGDLRENRRLREIFWAIQGKSITEAGLEDFIARYVPACPAHFQTKAASKRAPYSPEERNAILRNIPGYWRDSSSIGHQESWLQDRLWNGLKVERSGITWLVIERRRGFLASLDSTFFKNLCMDAAKVFLAPDLAKICADKNARLTSTWYCRDLTAALSEMMDAAAAADENSVARTAVIEKVFDAVKFALSAKALVRVDGSSRFGKSEGVRAYAAAHPGLVRLAVAPSTDPFIDWLHAIAEALGMDCDYRTPARELRMRVQHVMKYAGLGLIIDEAHFLLGSTLTRKTRPKRLDWTRLELVDKRVPVILVTTPQVFNKEVERFREFTDYNFDQWEGRMRRVALPETISEDDSLAVVRHKAPDFSPDLQLHIDDSAAVSGPLLANVQAIVDTARWNAQRAGRATPILADVENAIAETVPDASEQAPSTIISPARVTGPPANSPRSAPAPPRGITPALPAGARNISSLEVSL